MADEVKTDAEAPTTESYAAPSSTRPLRPTSASPGAFVASSMAKQEHARFFNALIYGGHGAGKTTLEGSAVDVPEMRDVLVVTAEGGTIVFEDNPRIENSDLIDTIKIDRIEQFQKVYEWLKAHIAFRDDPDKEDKLLGLQKMLGLDDSRVRRYRTVIVDSLSEIEALNLIKVMDLDKLGLDAGEEMEVAGYAEFRKNMHLMQKIVRQFRDLDIHVLMTCAQTYSQDERKAFHYSPKLTGQLKEIIQGFFDVVGWLVINNAVTDPNTGVSARRLYVQPQTAPRADAKNRLASYQGAFFENPTMEDILSATGFIKRGK